MTDSKKNFWDLCCGIICALFEYAYFVRIWHAHKCKGCTLHIASNGTYTKYMNTYNILVSEYFLVHTYIQSISMYFSMPFSAFSSTYAFTGGMWRGISSNNDFGSTFLVLFSMSATTVSDFGAGAGAGGWGRRGKCLRLGRVSFIVVFGDVWQKAYLFKRFGP